MRSADRAGVSRLRAIGAAWFIVMACGVLTPPVHGQTIYRCVQKGKPVSLQTTPCAAGATTTKTRDYTPEREPAANELAWKRYRIEREMQARRQARRVPAISGTAAVLPLGGSACEQAKAARDAWERRVGLSRTIDGMRVWQEHVYNACR